MAFQWMVGDTLGCLSTANGHPNLRVPKIGLGREEERKSRYLTGSPISFQSRYDTSMYLAVHFLVPLSEVSWWIQRNRQTYVATGLHDPMVSDLYFEVSAILLSLYYRT